MSERQQEAGSRPALEIVDISKTFRVGFFRTQIKAVRQVSFSARRGEIFGLLGPNGAGKTTTLKVLMGLIAPDRGEVRIMGRDSRRPSSRRNVGFLPENPYFHEYLTPRELLDFYGRLLGMGTAEIRRQRDELIEQVGLASAARLPLRKFSKGMLQRIGLAQALIHDPDLVVLDEPLSGLDPLGRKEVRDLILALRGQGKTVLFSSHILSDVEMICDRVGIMVRGQLRDIGKLGQLLSARVTETEVTLENAPASLTERAAAEGWPALKKGDRLRIRLPGDTDPGPLLSQALADGARVISVTPQTESLEDLFVREARKK
jgi:ABC-2 type transport system ATP-binding protein